MLAVGQVVVTEGERDSCVSKAIAAFSHSWATHCFLLTGLGTAVEAKFPRVVQLDPVVRLSALRDADRAYVVLDYPGVTAPDRLRIAQRADSYVGRWYDVGQLLLFALTHRFWGDGTGTLDCARLVTGAYDEGAHIDLFPKDFLDAHKAQLGHRIGNLAHGFPLPFELLTSKLEVVEFHPSSRIRAVADFLPR